MIHKVLNYKFNIGCAEERGASFATDALQFIQRILQIEYKVTDLNKPLIPVCRAK